MVEFSKIEHTLENAVGQIADAAKGFVQDQINGLDDLEDIQRELMQQRGQSLESTANIIDEALAQAPTDKSAGVTTGEAAAIAGKAAYDAATAEYGSGTAGLALGAYAQGEAARLAQGDSREGLQKQDLTEDGILELEPVSEALIEREELSIGIEEGLVELEATPETVTMTETEIEAQLAATPQGSPIEQEEQIAVAETVTILNATAEPETITEATESDPYAYAIEQDEQVAETQPAVASGKIIQFRPAAEKVAVAEKTAQPELNIIEPEQDGSKTAFAVSFSDRFSPGAEQKSALITALEEKQNKFSYQVGLLSLMKDEADIVAA